MDWTKAKTILIIALLITNLVLVFFIMSSYGDRQDDGKILSETIDYLEDHGVKLSAQVPEKRRRMPTLTVKYRTTDRDVVEKALGELPALDDPAPSQEAVTGLADSAVRAVEMMTDHTVLRQVEENEDGSFTVTYGCEIDGISVEESYIQCVIREGKVEALEWDWLEPVKYSRAKRKILPAAEALMSFKFELYRQKRERSAVEITGVEIIYWLNPEGLNTDAPLSEDTAYPAWKISYHRIGGEPETMYVDAMGDLTK